VYHVDSDSNPNCRCSRIMHRRKYGWSKGERREWFQRRKESSNRRERTFVCVAEIVCVLTGKKSHRDVEHPPEAYDVGDESISGAGLFLEN